MIVTIDTNIMFQALYSSSGASFYILKLVRSGYLQLALSHTVFLEYEEVLLRPSSLRSFDLSREDVMRILRYIAYTGNKYDPKFLFRPNLRDENDNIFVELAIASNSKFIVTSNINPSCFANGLKIKKQYFF
ncbi:MAG: putative toxin-antitoxin system toxin component, PIN family [Chloroflexi bacterium]|nr:MAG: putative toxin-antitoxin system toxin component, PIN family [Chloroflexota bacterium]